MAKKETESFMTIIGWAVIVFALYALFKLIQSKGLIWAFTKFHLS